MARKKKNSRVENSWKALQSEVTVPPGRSIPLSRRLRRLGKGLIGLTFALILGGAIFWVLYSLRQDEGQDRDRNGLPERPIKRVILNTDGVLNRDWLHENLEIRRNVDLGEVDIRDMRNQLLKHGQIKSVRVQREYPDQLVFNISEYRPFAKIVAVDPEGKRFLLMVSPEGNVYAGTNYPLRIWEELPFLGGVDLRRTENGFRPLSGMERVYDLWETARKFHPYLMAEWVEINISEYFPEREPYPGVIKVRSRRIPQIVFSPRNYRQQLEQLEVIQERHRNEAAGNIVRIDLTAQGQAAVQLRQH